MSLQGWYPLALSRDIEPSTSAGTRVEGKEFVVWRDAKGVAHLWEDRCPHRGMKMSFGFVRGDHLACLYHGWQYDTAGQCRYIPAHPDLEVPATIRIPRYAIAEAGGIIWGCFDGEVSDGPAIQFPVGDITPLRSVFADCPPALLAGSIAKTPVGNSVPQVAADGKRTLRITLGDVRLIAGIQPISEAETALHLVVAGAPATNELMHLSVWAEQLRRDVEQAAADLSDAEIAA